MQTTSTAVSRDNAVLVVIDIQDRLASVMADKDRVVDRTTLISSAMATTACPIIMTRQYPKGLGDVIDPVGTHLEAVCADGATVDVVDKVAFDCFSEPEFTTVVKKLGRSQLVIVGMETHICVTQTALSGIANGFDVHVVADGCCSRDRYNHEVALDRLRQAGAVVTTAESVAYELVAVAGTPEFKRLLAAVKS